MNAKPAPSGLLNSWLFRAVVIAALVGVAFAVRLAGADWLLDKDRLRAVIEGYGALAPAVYLAIYAVAPLLFIPGLPLTIAGGILFGPFWGVVYTIIGATTGASLAFLAARYAARDWVAGKLSGSRLKKLDADVERQGWKIVAVMRLIPLMPFNLLNFAFGLTAIGFWTFAVTSFFFMLPGATAYVVFSSSLFDLFTGHVSGAVVAGLALVLLVSSLPFLYRRYYKEG